MREAWKGDFDPRGPISRGQFHFLWPNLTLNIMPGHPNFSIGPIVPTGPETTARFLDYFVGPDVDDAWIAEMLEFDDQVGARTGFWSSGSRKACAAAASSTGG